MRAYTALLLMILVAIAVYTKAASAAIIVMEPGAYYLVYPDPLANNTIVFSAPVNVTVWLPSGAATFHNVTSIYVNGMWINVSKPVVAIATVIATVYAGGCTKRFVSYNEIQRHDPFIKRYICSSLSMAMKEKDKYYKEMFMRDALSEVITGVVWHGEAHTWASYANNPGRVIVYIGGRVVDVYDWLSGYKLVTRRYTVWFYGKPLSFSFGIVAEKRGLRACDVTTAVYIDRYYHAKSLEEALKIPWFKQLYEECMRSGSKPQQKQERETTTPKPEPRTATPRPGTSTTTVSRASTPAAVEPRPRQVDVRAAAVAGAVAGLVTAALLLLRRPALAILLLVLTTPIAVHAQSLVGSMNATVDEAALRVLYNHELDRSVVVVLHGSEYGTGWFPAPYRDVVVTAAHVVGYDPHATVVVIHGDYRVVGHVVALDKLHDVAVIRLERPWDEAKPLPLCSMVPKGDTLLVIGYPYELLRITGSIEKMSIEPRAAFGIVTWVDEERGIFEFQATTDQGNSGGPIVDVDSECVLGLVSFALKGTVGVTYFGTMSGYIRSALEKAGLHPLEKEPTAVPIGAPSLDEGNKSRLYAVVAAAVGGLLLGALLFNRQSF